MAVRVGLERLLQHHQELLKDQRVGLATHPAAVRRNLSGALDSLQQTGIQVVALFGPEHGFGGAVADGAAFPDSVDARTGLPVYSLYGTTTKPSAAVLNDIDVLLFDMQDVGVRFYTFISTLRHMMESAAQTGTPVIVLDRPNPINGVILEGPVLEPDYASFVGVAQIPVRYALTIGELACYMNTELGLGADLTVIQMENWHRSMWFDDTGLPWVPTSPAMPHTSTTALYPGMCLLEGTNLSEGRGTPLPFEICGAPWIDGHALAASLNEPAPAGVKFRPIQFVPSAPSKFEGRLCHGVQVHLLDRKVARPLTVGLHLIAKVMELYASEFAWREGSWEGAHPHFDFLMGTDKVRQALNAGADVNGLVSSWADDLTQFAEACRPYLLYS